MNAPARESIRFSSFGRSWLIVVRGKRGMAFDRWLVRKTGFSVVSLQYALAGRFRYQPTLLLTTVGARSGELREAALPYLRHGDSVVVVGSKGGGPVNPGWVANLRAHPLCWVRVRRKDSPMTARIASGTEREELFEYVVARKRNVARYQERADTFGRKIPLVVLSPYREELTKEES